MPTARDRILQRLARARASRAAPPGDAHATEHVPVAATVERVAVSRTPREQFEVELTSLGGTVHTAIDGVAPARVVGDICRHHGAGRVLAWSMEAIGVEGFAEGLAAEGITTAAGELPMNADPHEALAALDPISVGITGADGAIAESGSIALLSGPGRPRLASLLPPVHIAILKADRLYPSLAPLMTALGARVLDASNLVIITGPSRTADIEMTLTRGVHGPGEIHVVIVEASGSNAECGMRNAECGMRNEMLNAEWRMRNYCGMFQWCGRIVSRA